MSNPSGFLLYPREEPNLRPVIDRIKDYSDVHLSLAESKSIEQAARCMDCGVPFCHQACPLGNIIPEFNDAVQQQNWHSAFTILESTNNFPEFTGKICPAPCEAACVLGINQPAVTIERIEEKISEIAFEHGWVKAKTPKTRTGKKVAIIGSGPAGLAAAEQLNKVGHSVTVFEKNINPGGLLRYGIPDFKLEKNVVKRRLDLLKESGIEFVVNANVGDNIKTSWLQSEFDAIVVATGANVPRTLNVPDCDLKGVYFAMDYLDQNNKRVNNEPYTGEDILATGKNVVVIGGGDTGSDCIGTANRHLAKSISQLAYQLEPPLERHSSTPWPSYPLMLRTSSSQEEGCDRIWAVQTKAFLPDINGHIRAVQVIDVEWSRDEKGKKIMVEKPDTERELLCELLLIAIGFSHTEHSGLVTQLNLEKDERGNISEKNFKTNAEKVFVAGDATRGQSLVVWAISEGRECAREVDKFLMGSSALETKDN